MDHHPSWGNLLRLSAQIATMAIDRINVLGIGSWPVARHRNGRHLMDVQSTIPTQLSDLESWDRSAFPSPLLVTMSGRGRGNVRKGADYRAARRQHTCRSRVLDMQVGR